jgi:hypothetical protein
MRRVRRIGRGEVHRDVRFVSMGDGGCGEEAVSFYNTSRLT